MTDVCQVHCNQSHLHSYFHKLFLVVWLCFGCSLSCYVPTVHASESTQPYPSVSLYGKAGTEKASATTEITLMKPDIAYKGETGLLVFFQQLNEKLNQLCTVNMKLQLMLIERWHHCAFTYIIQYIHCNLVPSIPVSPLLISYAGFLTSWLLSVPIFVINKYVTDNMSPLFLAVHKWSSHSALMTSFEDRVSVVVMWWWSHDRKFPKPKSCFV